MHFGMSLCHNSRFNPVNGYPCLAQRDAARACGLSERQDVNVVSGWCVAVVWGRVLCRDALAWQGWFHGGW